MYLFTIFIVYGEYESGGLKDVKPLKPPDVTHFTFSSSIQNGVTTIHPATSLV